MRWNYWDVGDAKVDLIFKGGTCLLLRLHTLRRLSIDVDIICRSPAEELDLC